MLCVSSFVVWVKSQILLHLLHSSLDHSPSSQGDSSSLPHDLVLDSAVLIWEASGALYSSVSSHDNLSSCKTLLTTSRKVGLQGCTLLVNYIIRVNNIILIFNVLLFSFSIYCSWANCCQYSGVWVWSSSIHCCIVKFWWSMSCCLKWNQTCNTSSYPLPERVQQVSYQSF